MLPFSKSNLKYNTAGKSKSSPRLNRCNFIMLYTCKDAVEHKSLSLFRWSSLATGQDVSTQRSKYGKRELTRNTQRGWMRGNYSCLGTKSSDWLKIWLETTWFLSSPREHQKGLSFNWCGPVGELMHHVCTCWPCLVCCQSRKWPFIFDWWGSCPTMVQPTPLWA